MFEYMPIHLIRCRNQFRFLKSAFELICETFRKICKLPVEHYVHVNEFGARAINTLFSIFNSRVEGDDSLSLVVLQLNNISSVVCNSCNLSNRFEPR